MKKITLFVVVLFIYYNAICNENYQPGYIITLNKDTLHGYIDYKNWGKNPSIISFKEISNGSKINYTPLSIREFGVANETYVSAMVEDEISSLNLNELNYSSEPQINIDTVFLQALIIGTKSLYLNNDKRGREQLYIKQDSAYELLIYKKYLIEKDGGPFETENKGYQNQLAEYLSDYAEIEDKLKNIKYDHNDLQKVFYSYYKNVPGNIAYAKKKDKLLVEFRLLLGGTLTSLTFKSSNHPSLVDADYSKSLNFAGGISLDVLMPRNFKKWSLNNELIYTSYKINGSINEYSNPDDYKITNTTFGYSYIKLINTLRYKFSMKNFSMYINGGISNGYAVGVINQKEVDTKFYSTHTTETGKALDDTRKYEQGFVLGLGSKFKKYSFEIRYERGNGMSEYSMVGSYTNKFYCLFGFKL